MKNLLVCFCAWFLFIACWADTGRGSSTLVVPQDVSWSIRQIGLTRSIEGVSGGNKTIRNQTQNLSNSESVKESSTQQSERGSSKEKSHGWNADGKVSAGMKWGLIPTAGVEGAVGGHKGSENTEHEKSVSSEGTINAKERNAHNEDGSSTEGREEEKYGGYCLTFSLVLKSSNPADSFKVCATNAKIRLTGLTVPVVIPIHHPEFTLGAEERVLDVNYPIENQTLLRELVAVAAQGAWQRLSVVLNGYEFPILSEATGNNVISAMRVMEQNSPTTEIAVEFGDVMRLSPWRVRQRYGRASGKRGKLVSVRDALRAINERVAHNDEMPECLFEFNEKGDMVGVCDIPFVQIPTEYNLSMIGIRVDGDDKTMKVHAPTSGFLDSPIRNYSKIEFITVELADVADAVVMNDGLSELKDEVSSFAEQYGASNLWQRLLANKRPLPPLPQDRTSNATNNVEAINMTIYGLDFKSNNILHVNNNVEVYCNGKFCGIAKERGELTLTNIRKGDDLVFGLKICGLFFRQASYKVTAKAHNLQLQFNPGDIDITIKELPQK